MTIATAPFKGDGVVRNIGGGGASGSIDNTVEPGAYQMIIFLREAVAATLTDKYKNDITGNTGTPTDSIRIAQHVELTFDSFPGGVPGVDGDAKLDHTFTTVIDGDREVKHREFLIRIGPARPLPGNPNLISTTVAMGPATLMFDFMNEHFIGFEVDFSGSAKVDARLQTFRNGPLPAGVAGFDANAKADEITCELFTPQ